MVRSLPFLVVAAGLATACGPELVIERVEPAVLPAGEGGDIALFGAGLSANLTVALESQGITVTLGPAREREDGAILARVPAAAPEARFDVVASQGGASARLEGALTISAARAKLIFVDVGQGDGTLVVGPDGQTLLIDGGRAEAEDAVEDAIAAHAPAGQLDAVVLSHYDADHLGGVVAVLAGPDGTAGTDDDLVPPVRWAPVDDGSCDSQTCARFRALRAYPFAAPEVGTALDFGGLSVTVLTRDGELAGQAVTSGLDDNARSLVLGLEYAGRSALILGDLTGGGMGTADVETPLATLTGAVDVLRASHHGSDTSSASGAVSRWAPRLTVLSVGTDNAYCHPAEGALSRLAASSTFLVATGEGVRDDVDRCGAPTEIPGNAEFGRSTMVLEIDALGALTLDGERL